MNPKNKDDLIDILVQAARSILNGTANDDEPQDLWEIEQLKRAFRNILYPKQKGV